MNRKPQVSAAEYFAMREDDIVNVGEMTSPQIVVVLKYDLDDIGRCDWE